ncbi:MAG: hypothetical protein K2M69_00535 [Muribaculaceae bacterium]|nr:hypothetical protein [Muribaculaceae bacterium]
MATKKTTDQIVTAYRLLNNAKLSKMEDAEKFAVIKIARKLRKASADFDELVKDAQERLKPDNFDIIASKMQANKELTPEESAAVEKYNRDITACVREELEKEVEPDFEPISEEAFGRLIASNDFSTAEVIAIDDVICSGNDE